MNQQRKRAAATVLLGAALCAQSPLRRVDLATPCDIVAAAGDFDADGDVDGLEWNVGVGLTGRVVLNDGNGRFAAVAASGLPFPSWTPLEALSIADYDGDGFGDVLAIGTGTPYDGLYKGNAAFAFAPGPLLPQLTSPAFAGPLLAWSHAPADVDGDGDLDVVGTTRTAGMATAGPPFWWRNLGAGAFAPASGGALGSVAAGYFQTLVRDVDADGDADAVFAGGIGGVLRVYLNDGAGNFAAAAPFTPVASFYPGVALGDFDGDTRTDLAYMTNAGTTAIIEIAFGVPGGFASPISTAGLADHAAFPLLAVDLDADGVDELLVRKIVGIPAPGMQTYRLTAASVAVSGVATATGATFDQDDGGARLGDLDGDGDLDVLRDAAGFLMNDGAGGLVAIETAGDPAGKALWRLSRPVACGDFDGDGTPDVVGASMQTAYGDGAGGFTYAPGAGLPAPFVGQLPVGLGVAFDRDQDGDRDVFVSASSGAVAAGFVLDNVGGALAAVAGPFTLPPSTRAAFAAFDGDLDGDLDLCVGVAAGGFFYAVPPGTPPLRWMTNYGAAGFAAPVGLGPAAGTNDLIRGDFDGDGADDLLQLNGALGDASALWLARFGGPLAVAQPGLIGAFGAAGDLDGDGVDEAVVDGAIYAAQGGAFVAIGALPDPLRGYAELVDLDGDGDLDLVETPATVMMNHGGLVFGAPESALPRSPGWVLQQGARSCAADVDFDGDLDVVAPGPTVVLNVTRHLVHDGPPRLGRPSGVKLFGTPGGALQLFASPLAAATPLPPFGTLLLDPATLVWIGAGSFAPPGSADPGEATLPFFVPNTPSLAGLTLHWQAVDVGTAAFTNRLTSVVASY